MQLAHAEQHPDQEISPSIRAVPVDSLFEAPGTVLTGIIFSGIAAAMTALKTGQNLTWACVALLMITGAVRAFDLQRYSYKVGSHDERTSRAFHQENGRRRPWRPL